MKVYSNIKVSAGEVIGVSKGIFLPISLLIPFLPPAVLN